jgi:hypothetical protein
MVFRWKGISRRMSAPSRGIVNGREEICHERRARTPHQCVGRSEQSDLLTDLTTPSVSTAEIRASARLAALWGLLSSGGCVMQSFYDQLLPLGADCKALRIALGSGQWPP